MARLRHVAKSRKPHACMKCGGVIKKGDAYYWWKNRITSGKSYIGVKKIRCMKPECRPTPSDMTSSEYLGRVGDLQQRGFSGETFSDLQSERDEMVNEVNQLRDEQDEKLNNMPEGLQQGDTGNTIQERIDSCDLVASELEGVYIPDDVEEITFEDDGTGQQFAVKRDSEKLGTIKHTKTSRSDYWDFTPADEKKADEDSRVESLDAVKDWCTENLNDEDGPGIEDVRDELQSALDNLS